MVVQLSAPELFPKDLRLVKSFETQKKYEINSLVQIEVFD